MGRFLGSRGAFGSLLGGLLASLGDSWGVLGRFRGALGSLLGPPWARLGACEGALGGLLGPHGLPGGSGDPFWTDFGGILG